MAVVLIWLVVSAWADDLKLKISWSEAKSKKGHRVAVVTIRNEGWTVLKEIKAEIGIVGKGEKERQPFPLTLNVERNREMKVEVPLVRYNDEGKITDFGMGFGGGSFGTVDHPAIGEIERVEVVVMGQVFKSGS